MTHLTYQVCALADLKRCIKSLRASHVVSLIDLGMDTPRVPSRIRSQDNHLVLHMHDLDGVDDGTMRGNPHRHHIDKLLAFAGTLTINDRVVFHCVAGKRRSTAAAWICDIALRLSHGSPANADTVASSFAQLIHLRPIADPNRALLHLADTPLKLDGALAQFALPPRVLDLSTDNYCDPVV